MISVSYGSVQNLTLFIENELNAGRPFKFGLWELLREFWQSA